MKSGRFQISKNAALPKTAADLQKLINNGEVSYKVQNSITRFQSSRQVSEFVGEKVKTNIKEKSGLFGVRLNKNVISIIKALNTVGIQCKTEYVFHPRRMFRFDIVVLPIENKIAIEYEGIFSEKSRHTTFRGYPEDCKKYRLATILGWRILRYTSVCIKGRNGEYRVVEDVKKLLTKTI